MEYLKNIKNYTFNTINLVYDYFAKTSSNEYIKGEEESISEKVLKEEDKFVDISKINICEIYPYIVKVNGFTSNSASPTDTWSIIFKDNIVAKNSFIKDAFLKIFIDDEKVPELAALNYELQIYRDIITNIMNKKICSNFVKYLDSGYRCSYNDLFNFLKNNTEYDGSMLSDEQISKNLNRNIYIMSKGLRNRPSIQEDTKMPFKLNSEDIRQIKTYKFNMILTENIKPPSLTLFEWIVQQNFFKNPSEYILEEFWNILFQICYGCYCMSLSKLVHNDLHSGNIFIQNLKLPIEIIYIVNNIPVIIRTRYKAVIYDFDRGYIKSRGKNPINDGNNCIRGSQCNTYIENIDITKILCYVYGSLSNNRLQNQVLNIFSDDISVLSELKNVYNIKTCFLQDNSGFSKQTSFYEKINNTKKILDNIINNLSNKEYDESKKYMVYSCNENYFNTDGTLNNTAIDIYQKNSVLIKNSISEDEIQLNNLINKKLDEDREKIILENIKKAKKLSLDRRHQIMLEAKVERQRLNVERERIEEKERREEKERKEKERKEKERKEREEKEREEREEKERKEREEKDPNIIKYCKDCKKLLDTLKIDNKKSFYLWARENHPDKFNLKEEKLNAEEIFKKVSPCYIDWSDNDSICKYREKIYSFSDSEEAIRQEEFRKQEEAIRERKEREEKKGEEREDFKHKDIYDVLNEINMS
jgi:hypothetical protein